MPSTLVAFRIEEDKRDQLDKIAEALDRDRTWVINDAIDQYLASQKQQSERIQKAIANIESGNYTTFEALREKYRHKSQSALAKKAR